MSRTEWYHKWLAQVRLMLWKNYRVALRNRKTTVLQFISPVFFILTLFVFQKAIESTTYFGDLYNVRKHQEPEIIRSIPLCSIGDKVDRCWTFVYAPNNNPEVERVIRMIREQNDPPIPESSVMGFADATSVDDFLYKNQNTTQGAYLFDFIEPNINETLRTLAYTVQVNFTDNYSHGILLRHQERIEVPMVYAVEKALMMLGTNSSLTWDVTLIKFPHDQVLTVNMIGQYGPLFLFAALIVNFVIALGQVVAEKELKLRESMKIMGLYDSAYWVSWFITTSFWMTTAVFVLIISGCIFQFNFFLKNNFGLYFLLLWLFAMSLVSLSFLASTVAKKANAATSLGFGLFFIGYFLQFAVQIVFSESSSVHVRNILSFLCPAMLQVGLTVLGAATEKESYPGLSWEAVNKPEITSNSVISFQQMYGWLILDFFIYLFLAMYLDNVLKNDQGTRKPYHYFLTKSYWTGQRYMEKPDLSKKLTTEAEYDSFDTDVKEEEETIFGNKLPENTAVVLQNLCKVYERSNGGFCSKKEEFRAVKDLSYYIEDNSLFCFLGPNGAGKTTTISMLVGFHEASYGDATICGYSIRDQMSQIQSFMGLCPQFDILWGELTGEEHLRLFAGLRNLSKPQIESEVNRLLDKVSLHSNAHVRTSAYSGGERRRLSVAIALIGDPKIVILDEPTTGMDPVSRREVWNVIEKAKKNRVVILTTHSMEEADVLGDKIGIVARGRLQCIGSSLHLKQKFGAGYTITIGTAENQVTQVQDFFEQNLKGATLTSPPLAGYLRFAVDKKSEKELVPFFKELERHSKSLGIHDTQLSITTLEQVFLTVAENSEAVQEEPAEYENDITDPETLRIEPDPEPLTKQQKIRDQFVALFIKSGKLQAREYKTNICQILTPFVFLSILLGFQELIGSIVPKTPEFDNRYPSPYPQFFMLPATLYATDADLADLQLQLVANGGPQLFYAAAPDVDISLIGDYNLGTGVLGKYSPSAGNTTALMWQKFGSSKIDYREFDYLPITFVAFNDEETMEKSIFDGHYSSPQVVGGYYFETLDFTKNIFKWSVIYNSTFTYEEDVPTLMNRMTNAITQNLASPFKLKSQVKPFPTVANDGVAIDVVALGGNVVLILVLHQLLPVFMTNVVAEKESKIRELMRMTGLRMSLYWIIHYMFDYFMYLVVTAILIISGEIYSIRFFTINDFGAYYLLFLVWGHVLIAISFLMSVFFTTRKAASVVGYLLVIAVGLFTFVLLDNLLGDFDSTPENVRLGVSVIPPFALYKGLMYLTAEVKNEGPGYRMADTSNEVVNLNSVYIALVIEWVVLMLFWWYLEQIVPSQFGLRKHPLFFLGYKEKHPITDQSIKKLPADVRQERETVFSSNDLAIKVQDINKVYPAADGNLANHAVKNLSFGVGPAMCHGILGHNGAGKTTLLNVLIGLYPPNSGNAYIYGNSITENPEPIHSMMGVCTQYDILWENMTGYEHLQFFGRLRNLKGEELTKKADAVLKKLNLFESRNVVSAKYSGGMKRRLSVAIALLGYPKAIFLDEPSTGLDPKSRERMWRLINEAKQTSSILLTTHSMEEADAICDRLMIMTNGELSCIGVSSDLKNRFGEGFKLSVQVAKGQDQKPTEDFIKKQIPRAVLLNSLAGTRNYQIPVGVVTLDQVFAWMEENKASLHITDWAITHTTLEEVFLKLSQHDKESDVEVKVIEQREDLEMRDFVEESASISAEDECKL